MIKNHMVVALRNLFKNKLNTFIIIIGLGIGIACSTLSYLFIQNELSFDKFHEKLSEIFEVKMILSLSVGRAVSVPKAQTALDLVEQFPEVESAVRMEMQNLIVYFEGSAFEENAIAADPSFLDVFTFPFESSLERDISLRPNSVVLTRNAAQKYFGDKDPVGEVLSMRVGDTASDFLVAGVLRPIPNASSLDFDFLIPLANVYGESLNDSRGPSVSCFIQLTEAEASRTLPDKFRDTIDMPLREKYSDESGHTLQPFADYHLKGGIESQALSHKSSIQYSFILAGISLLVLLMAGFNFINLSIGKASTRIKEIGVRKVVGAQRSQLVRQFWFESLLFGFLALLTGLVMTELIIPAFNGLTQKKLMLDVFSSLSIIVFFIGLVLFIGIAAGSFPALLLSKFNPVELFRGQLKISRKNTFSRTLIILQFAISIFLIVSTTFLLKQKTHMLNTRLGYTTDHVIVIPLKNLIGDSNTNSVFLETLKNKLLPYESIESISGSHFSFPEGWMGTYFVDIQREEPNLVVYNYVDHDFIPTLGMNLVAGRNFSEDFPADYEGSIIINESFRELLAEENPLGRRLNEFFSTDFDRMIIGVVEDFHYESLRDPIYPAFIGMAGMDYQNVFVKLKGDGIRESLKLVEREFKALAPQIPYEFTFLDDAVARQYERENRWIQMVESASLFAILIACSGLFGLTLQILFLRTKEIGIRRVLGATVRNIILLINKEFLRLVLLSNMLAWPAAYFAVSAFLRNYAFRVAVTPWIFLGSGLLGLLLAGLTVSIHAIKTARLNPAYTLKTE